MVPTLLGYLVAAIFFGVALGCVYVGVMGVDVLYKRFPKAYFSLYGMPRSWFLIGGGIALALGVAIFANGVIVLGLVGLIVGVFIGGPMFFMSIVKAMDGHGEVARTLFWVSLVLMFGIILYFWTSGTPLP